MIRGDELLVFEHRDFPEAGLQVPAGTVEDGEDPRDAVLRELYEESGIADATVVRMAGRYDYDARPYRNEIHDRHVYQFELTTPAPSRWLYFERNPSDGGVPIAFRFFWVRVSEAKRMLAGNQGDLLDMTNIDIESS